MTREDICVTVAAVLTTALETEPDPFPESMVYLALEMDLPKWEAIRGLLVASDLVIVRQHAIRLTEKGRETARQCAAVG